MPLAVLTVHFGPEVAIRPSRAAVEAEIVTTLAPVSIIMRTGRPSTIASAEILPARIGLDRRLAIPGSLTVAAPFDEPRHPPAGSRRPDLAQPSSGAGPPSKTDGARTARPTAPAAKRRASLIMKTPPARAARDALGRHACQRSIKIG